MIDLQMTRKRFIFAKKKDMEPTVVIILFVGTLLVSVVIALCGLYVRRHPEQISGYNTMSREKLAKIDLPRIGRFISNMIFAAIPFMLAAPFMPNLKLFEAMLVSPLLIFGIVAVLYVNIFEKRFMK